MQSLGLEATALVLKRALFRRDGCPYVHWIVADMEITLDNTREHD